MKKILALAFALLLSISVSAQTPLTEAVNFSSTAHNGEEIDLFEILDGGQYVLIDFFFSTSRPCKEVAPRLIDAYYMLGCNEGDIYFMEVSPTDHNASYSIGHWFDQFDIPYPTIHTKTGGVTGDKIREMYQVESYPTLILIAPDRKIVLQHYYPESAESMVEYFTTNFDIEENYCDQTPSVSIEKTKFDGAIGKDVLEASTKVHVDFRANIATEKFYYTISESANLTSEDVIADSIVATEREFSYTFEGLKSETTYFVYAQAVGHDGTNGEKTVIETRTLCPGDGGEVAFELTVQISASHVIAKAVPSESTADYHFGFTRKEYYDEGADSTTFPTENQFIFLNALANDDYPFCETETYEVPIKKDDGTPTFFPNTPYYLVAIGRNGEGQWFAPTLYEFVVEQAVGPATVDLNVKPMGTSVTISAVPNEFAVEFHYGLATKAKYDELGADSLTQIIRNDGFPFYQASESTWDNLTPETEYVAIGTALNAGNEWGETAIEFFTTDDEDEEEGEDPETPVDPEQPNQPTDSLVLSAPALAVDTVTETTVVLVWNAIDSATSYNVYMDSVLVKNVTDTIYTVDSLISDSTYNFMVTAVADTLESEFSNVVTVTTLKAEGEEPEQPENPENPEEPGDEPEEPIELDTPENVEATATSTSSIIITWDKVENALSYNIYRDGELLDDTENTNYTDKDLEYNTEYCYTIEAVNGKETSDESEEVCVKTLGEGVEEHETSFNIYPNPVNDKLYIETLTQTQTQTQTVEIYDVYGRLQVTETPSHQGNLSIDVTSLNSGVYFVKVVTSEGEAVKRFIKK